MDCCFETKKTRENMEKNEKETIDLIGNHLDTNRNTAWYPDVGRLCDFIQWNLTGERQPNTSVPTQ